MARGFAALILCGLVALAAPAQADTGGAPGDPEVENAPVPPEAAADAEEEPFPLHLDLEVAWMRQAVRFFTPPEALVACGETCFEPGSFSQDALRATIGLGWGVFTLEGSVAVPPASAGNGIWMGTWSAGFRVDTSWTALFSMFFRGAYIQRWGTVPGQGGRFALGLQIRPVRHFAIFAEGSIDGTTVPSYMNRTGTAFSYSMGFAVGVRVAFSD